MTNDRNINIGSGSYNENVQVQGDFVQGDKVQSSKIINQDLSQTAIDIQQLLQRFQSQYSLVEAQEKTATELANQARKNPEIRNKLTSLGSYIAANGGIEAGIGKAIELALKLLGI